MSNNKGSGFLLFISIIGWIFASDSIYKIKDLENEVSQLKDDIQNLNTLADTFVPFLPDQPMGTQSIKKIFNSTGVTQGWFEVYHLLPHLVQMFEAKKVEDDSKYQRHLAILRSYSSAQFDDLTDAGVLVRKVLISKEDFDDVSINETTQSDITDLWPTTVHEHSDVRHSYHNGWSLAALRLYTHPRLVKEMQKIVILSNSTNNVTSVEQYLLSTRNFDIQAFLEFYGDAEFVAFAQPYLQKYDAIIAFNEVEDVFSLQYKMS